MVSMGEMGSNIALGFSVAFSLKSLFYCFLGVFLGTLVGVLPGIGILATLSLLMPLTFYLDPTTGLIMLAGIYYGAAYGGSTASILLNLPGTPQSAVTCLDGYPMARRGRAGQALFITTIASFVGSFIGMVLLAIFAPQLAVVAMQFQSPEYFSMMAFGLLAASLLTSEAPFRSLSMVAFGIVLGIVGIDIGTGAERFTFGQFSLLEGLPLVAIALGLFGIPEVIANSARTDTDPGEVRSISLRSMLPSRSEWTRSWAAMLRGSGVGSFFGTLPGTGGVTASFMSYALEKRIHKDPSQFGKGAVEGIASPEAANNSAVQTSFIPTMTLGIPGDPVMAIMIGVLMIHGIAPGPNVMVDHPDMFWGLVVSFLIGNVILVILNIPLISLWVWILKIPYSVLFPAIVMFVCLGVYTVQLSISDLVVVMAFGLMGYVFFLLRFSVAPLLLGLVLGPMVEENLRRSMILSRGDPLIFLQRPISAAFIAISLAMIAWLIFSHFYRRRRTAVAAID